MNKKFKYILLLSIVVFTAFYYRTSLKASVDWASEKFLTSYVDMKMAISHKIDEHIAQKEEIQRLKAENQDLQKSAVLSVAFAQKLNDLLKERNISKYEPQMSLVTTIGYSNLSDYSKVRLAFEPFDSNRIYGLLSQGAVAGIVVASEANQPQGLLLSDPKAVFSVYVGNQKIQGVSQGNRKEVLVKYISQWLEPKVGDEVVTSGLDGIFFEGIKVGTVTEIIQEESFKTVVIKPYTEPRVPSYMYVITKP